MNAQPQFIHEPTQRFGVWNKRGHFPRKFFNTFEEASRVAETMCARHPEQGKFHVLQLVEKVSMVAPTDEKVL